MKKCWLVPVFLMMILTACGGGGSEGVAPSPESPSGGESPEGGPKLDSAPSDVTLRFEPVKIFRFEWTDVEGATYYQLLENLDGMSGFSPVDEAVPQGVETLALEVPLYARVNAEYVLQACNTDICVDSDVIYVSGALDGSIGTFKSSDTEALSFGNAVALSADGGVLAVGAPGVLSGAGAAYIFSRGEGGRWGQTAHLRGSNTDAGDAFGSDLALSADGQTLAVGAYMWDDFAGAVYVFSRTASGGWSQQANLKGDVDSDEGFGRALSLSAQGQSLAVGVADATGGAAYIFSRNTSGSWSKEGYIKLGDTEAKDVFGGALSMSADGSILAVGALGDDSGVSDDEGSVYVFARDADGGWGLQASLKADNAGSGDFFGASVSLSSDGQVLAVGAPGEASGANGVDGDGSDDSVVFAGAVYIFARGAGEAWSQQAYLKASNTDEWDSFGWVVSLGADGQALAVGAIGEQSNAVGVNGSEDDNSFASAGAVYMFTHDIAKGWRQQAYLKASKTSAEVEFGYTLSLSADAHTLAVGALRDGAIYLY